MGEAYELPKTILTTASAALISGVAFAGSHMSMEMTISLGVGLF